MSRRYEITNAVFHEVKDDSRIISKIEFGCVDVCVRPSLGSTFTEDSSSDLTSITSCSLSVSSLSDSSDNEIQCPGKTFKTSLRLFQELFSELNVNEKQERPSTKDSKRANMSFTNEQTRKIKRENEILLHKIMSRSNSAPCGSSSMPKPVKCSAEVNRKRRQERINRENLFSLHYKKGIAWWNKIKRSYCEKFKLRNLATKLNELLPDFKTKQ